MNEVLLIADYEGRKLVSEDGGSPAPQRFVLGDKYRAQLSLVSVVGSATQEVYPHVRSMRVAVGLGKGLDPATGGTFTLTSGGLETEAIAFNADAATLTTRLNTDLAASLVVVAGAVSPSAGVWEFRLSGAAVEPVEFVVGSNMLAPSCFVRSRPFQRGDDWWYEIRLVQSPLAYTSTFNRVLPPPPTVTTIRDGALGEPGVTVNSNEVQAVDFPADFTGSFYFRWNYRTSAVVGVEEATAERLAEVLNGMFSDGKTRFVVTNPTAGRAQVEFVGPLKEADQLELEVVVQSFDPGPLTFDLSFNTAEAAAALRIPSEVEAYLEIELEVVDTEEALTDMELPSRIITVAQQKVALAREIGWEEISTLPTIDWGQPPQPVDYIPFTLDQVITGAQHYSATIGNGVATTFVVTHALGTSAAHVAVRLNTAGGRLLQAGADYQLEFTTANIVTLTFSYVLASGGAAIVISTAGPVSAFRAHTHTIGQIVGLQDILDGLETRVSTIEDRLPFTVPGSPVDPQQTVRELSIPDFYESFPGRFPKDTKFTLEPTKAIRPGGLLPAVHDATPTNVTAIPAVVGNTGQVVKNNAAPELLLPGSMGRKSRYIKQNEFAACDGRCWYAVRPQTGTNSYYPVDFERTLFMLSVNDKQLRPGDSMQVDFDLGLTVVGSQTRAQYLLEIEVGTVPQQTTPSPVGVNLSDVVWSALPMFSQRIILTSLTQAHTFGIALQRSLENVLTADALNYSTWEAVAESGALPATANFLLRACVREFDTENSVSDARGLVHVTMTKVTGAVTLN